MNLKALFIVGASLHDIMSNRKYRFADNNPSSRKRRIQALRDIGDDVRAGDYGGHIYREEALPQDDDSWVYNGAELADNASIAGNVKVRESRLSGYAEATGNVTMKDCDLRDEVAVRGDTDVPLTLQNVRAYGRVKIRGSGVIKDEFFAGRGSLQIKDGKVVAITTSRPFYPSSDKQSPSDLDVAARYFSW